MKITILGCGALGQIWLSRLYQQGQNVQGWLRVPQSFCSVNVIWLDGSSFSHNLPANDLEHLSQSELLLVTLKAGQVCSALTPLLPLLNPHCAILLLHNGMGVQDELPPHNQPILQGVTTHAARHDGHTVIHVANGVTHIGPMTPQAISLIHLAKVMHKAIPNVVWHDHIATESWRKLAVNCVINPLTVFYNCRNGDLQRYPHKIVALCHEVMRVMEKEGYHDLCENLIPYVMQVIQNTADNVSSMLQDIRCQRHSEIDYITGYLLRRGNSHGLSLPENTRLFEWIKQKEKEYISK